METLNIDAIRILQDAATQAARSGAGLTESSAAITTLHNAVFYLLTGRLDRFGGMMRSAT